MRYWTIAVILIMTSLACTLEQALQSSDQRHEDTLKRELAYLSDQELLPEISWVRFDGNDVYIGFNAISPDLSAIVRGAAVRGNKAIDFGVHVWAVDEVYTDFDKVRQPYICEATARHGPAGAFKRNRSVSSRHKGWHNKTNLNLLYNATQ